MIHIFTLILTFVAYLLFTYFKILEVLKKKIKLLIKLSKILKYKKNSDDLFEKYYFLLLKGIIGQSLRILLFCFCIIVLVFLFHKIDKSFVKHLISIIGIIESILTFILLSFIKKNG